MERLIILDSWILIGFERFSHRWQKLTGRDCFWLSRISFVFAPIVHLIFSIGHAVITGDSIIPPVIISVWLLFATTFTWFYITGAEKRAKDHAGKGFSNPLKIEDREIRIAYLIITVIFQMLFFIAPFSLTGILLFFNFHLCGSYFFACDPLPPAKSKVSQWLEAGVSAVKKFLAPMPQPVPNPS